MGKRTQDRSVKTDSGKKNQPPEAGLIEALKKAQSLMDEAPVHENPAVVFIGGENYDGSSGLPYNLKRELEEISKNSGRVIDFTLPISELEDICNEANNPPASWRNRWE